MGSSADGGHEGTSTHPPLPSSCHCCPCTETTSSSGGRGLWTRQSVVGRARSGGGQPDLSLDVGEFPYPRGETPVFNFDQGDEGFIGTIPPLIHALDAVKDTVHKQRKITQAFGEAFDLCEACG